MSTPPERIFELLFALLVSRVGLGWATTITVVFFIVLTLPLIIEAAKGFVYRWWAIRGRPPSVPIGRAVMTMAGEIVELLLVFALLVVLVSVLLFVLVAVPITVGVAAFVGCLFMVFGPAGLPVRLVIGIPSCLLLLGVLVWIIRTAPRDDAGR
jgi:hypothetical protein